MNKIVRPHNKETREAEPVINVAVAIIKKGDRVLIGRRGPGRPYAGKWEFPGGKIDEGETPEECVRREVKEEFDVEITNVQPHGVFQHTYEDGKRYNFFTFYCEIPINIRSFPTHQEVVYVPVNDLKNFDLLEGDKKLIEKIKEDFGLENRKIAISKPDEKETA